MTISRTVLLSAILTLGWPSGRAMAADGWGASWSFGPTTSRIVHARTTLVPGRLPPITSTTGPLFLWPGLSNPTSDLIQTTMDAWPNNNGYCGAATGQWCVEASVFGSFGQRNGPNAPIDPDDHVTIEYTLGTDGNTWTQTVTSEKLGRVVSTLQSASGPMPKGGFGFATEADADSFTIDTQYYLCTELDLAEADPHFGATGVGGIGAQYGATGTGSGIGTAKNVRTPDEGLTWLVDLVTLPAMQPQGTQTAAPAFDCATEEASDAGEANDASGASGLSGSSGGGGHGDAGPVADGGHANGDASATGAGSGDGTGGAGSGGSGASGGSTGGESGSGTGNGSGGASSRGSDASASGANGAATGSSAPGSGSASTDAAANGSAAGGCGCALVGAEPETHAGLSALSLVLAAMLVRRRRD
ncbi:MAG TPA: hypothetical protein VK841_11240 [Polyangiaceae bacterium]|nr:hypothetical protein [Polyangiaceae bacterium]